MADIDIRSSGSTANLQNGAFFTNNITTMVSGTGVFDPFLATHANDGTAEGFSTNQDNVLDIDNTKTTAIKVSDIPIRMINGVAYFEIRLDVNEPNNANKDVTLNQLKVYTSTQPATTGDFNNTTDELDSDFTKVFDLDAGGDNTLLLRDNSSGSGTDDYAFYLPVTSIGTFDANTYLTLYANFGRPPTLGEEGGFEEWRTEKASSITGFKFSDDNGNGERETGEQGLAGFTIFIDTDKDGVLDVGERSTVTDANGFYAFYGVPLSTATNGTIWIDEQLTAQQQQAGYVQTSGDHEEVSFTADGQIISNVLIGNFLPNPDLTIDKTVVNVRNPDGTDDADDTVDEAGDVIHYNIRVTNAGNVTLTGVTVNDPLLGGALSGATTIAVGTYSDYTGSYTVTQADLDGNGGGDGDIDNTATASSTETGSESDSEQVALLLSPDLTIDKTVVNVRNPDGTDDADDTVDEAGDVIHYNIRVTNAGNVTLTGVTVNDPLLGGALSGATTIAVGTYSDYTGSYTVTQADLDGNGGGDGDIDNTATASSTETGSESDSEQVALLLSPSITLQKYVSVDGGANYDDADTVTGPNVSVYAPIFFKINVANTGNVTLTNVTISDLLTNYTNNTTSNIDLSSYTLVESDGVNDGTLAPGKTAELIYSSPFAAGQHTNTATVNTTQGATASDAANYFGLVNEGPGVRTPGFWSNLGARFWDGEDGNEPKQSGTTGFADGERLYAVDYDGIGGVNGRLGLLLGDYNQNGIADAGEDTIFISLANAKTLINASQKQLQDGTYVLGRDAVATWLNYLAGNDIGTAADPQSPRAYLSDAIDWFQTLADGNPTNDDFEIFGFGSAVKQSSAGWKSPGTDPEGNPYRSAATIHDHLDYYNNTGMTSTGGTVYAGDADSSSFLLALGVARSWDDHTI